ncbi:MAG: GntR family transcriptional regulator [Mycoplasmatales bacterium]
MLKKSLAEEIGDLIIKDYYENKSKERLKELPTQHELQQKYYVSRSTIVKALNILKAKKVIYSIQGKGSFFVQGKLELYLAGIYSYDYQLNQMGVEVENQVINYQVVLPNEDLRQHLKLTENEKLIEIIRKKIDKHTKEILIIQRNYLKYNRFKNLNIAKINTKRLYVVLTKEYNLNLTKAKERIMLSTLPKQLNKYVNAKKQNVLKIVRQAYEKESLIEYTESYLLTANFVYDVDLNFQELS